MRPRTCRPGGRIDIRPEAVADGLDVVVVACRSAAITARAMAAGFRQAAPGVTEREVARAVGETMMREGADRPGFIVMVSGADNHHVLSGKPTDRALESGDMLWMDLGSVYRGYWSDFCRACVVGGPTRAQRDAQAVIVEVNQACVDAVRPGEPIHRVPAAAEAAFARLGMDVEVGPGASATAWA